MSRKVELANGEIYHIFNRGVEKRETFLDSEDFSRFFQSMNEFNTEKPIGSIFENQFTDKKLGSLAPKLVEFVAFCLNDNHFHFVIKQNLDNGINKFMQKLGTGYTNYFNNKYKRSGSLFQGSYKAAWIDSNEYLLHLSAYVNLNNEVHRLGSLAPKSSWGEYVEGASGFCDEGKKIILEQFGNAEKYKEFAESSLEDILKRRSEDEGLDKLLIE